MRLRTGRNKWARMTTVKGEVVVSLCSLFCWSDPNMWRLQDFIAFAFQVNDLSVKSSTSALWLSISFSVSSLALNFSVGVGWWHPWPLLEIPFSLNYFQFPERPLDDWGTRLASSFPDFGLQWSHLQKQDSMFRKVYPGPILPGEEDLNWLHLWPNTMNPPIIETT